MRSFQGVCTVFMVVLLVSIVFAFPCGIGCAAEPAKKLNIVFFGAHCDDNELGAGGLMRMLADQGHEVISAYATAFRRGRTFFDKPEETVRHAESSASCKILGATPYFFPYAHEDLEKPFADKKTLDEIVAWFDKTQPDIVVAHWPLDSHSNHQVVGMSAWMAYLQAKRPWNLYFYEVNTFTKPSEIQTHAFVPNVYVDVGKVRDVKKRAIDCLKSQKPEDLWAMHDNMQVQRGKQCGVKYAEVFVLVEAKPGCPLLPVPFLPCKL
jgi:N-acetylglucosamine malate deacetylase 1